MDLFLTTSNPFSGYPKIFLFIEWASHFKVENSFFSFERCERVFMSFYKCAMGFKNGMGGLLSLYSF